MFKEFQNGFGKDFKDELETALDDLNVNTNTVNQTLNTEKNRLDDRIDNIITNNPQPSEVVDARYDPINEVTHATLKERLDNASSELAENANRLNSKEIDAFYPPAPLIGVYADNTNDDATIIQNLLNHIDSNYVNGGELKLPNKSMKCLSGLVIPSTVRMGGDGENTILDFSSIGSGVTFNAITVNDSGVTPVHDLVIKGNGVVSVVDTYAELSVTTSTGISITGSNLFFEKVIIRNFNIGVNLANDNTYLVTFSKSEIHTCQTDIYLKNGTESSVNAGERITFKDCNLFNSGLILDLDGTTTGVFFDGCSLDYCNEFMHVKDTRVYINNCHIESCLETASRGWRSKVNYLFSTTGSGRIYFSNIDFNLFQIQYIVNPDSYYGTAFARYNHCTAWFRDELGVDRSAYSEQDVFFLSGATTVSFYSCFVSKIVYPSATFAASYNSTQKNLIAYITTLDVNTGQVVVTMSGSAPSNGFVKVRF